MASGTSTRTFHNPHPEYAMQLASILRPARSLLVLLACAMGAVQAAEVAAPVVLVATERLAGSGYRETVLIAAPLRNGASIGFIINRPTGVKLGALFPEHAASRKVVDPVYFGGPALPESLFVIARRAPQGEGAGGEVVPLTPGLVLVLDGATVDRVIETMPNDARYFAGVVVWRPGELDEELRAGAWQVLPADAKTVFHADPAGLWRSLHRAEEGAGRSVRIRLGQPQSTRAAAARPAI
jgi:putative transcriptional regulator